MKKTLLACFAAAVAAISANAITLTKTPNLGVFYGPLSATGTYVYANSFVAPIEGEAVELGAWLNASQEDPSTALVFHILGSISGNPLLGPNMGNILATSASISNITEGLSFYSASVSSSATLTANETYWFAISALDATGSGRFSVGGHLQNTDGINDNGTFWHSNDPDGLEFESQDFPPEMAFSVTLAEQEQSHGVPDTGTTLSLFGLALVGLAAFRRR